MSFRRKILRYWEKRGKKEVQKLQKRIAKSRQANVKAQNELEKMERNLVKAKKEINKRKAGTLVGKEPTTFTPTLSPLRRERNKSQNRKRHQGQANRPDRPRDQLLQSATQDTPGAPGGRPG